MKPIIKSIFTSLLAVAVIGTLSFSMQACRKKKPEPPQEANLVVSLDPAPSSTTTPVVALGTTYDFRVKVESTMPAQGVDIQVAYRKDSDNSTVFAQTYTTTTSPQAVTVTGIPFNQVGTVTVTVVSKTKPDNTVQKTFKLVKK